MPTPADLTARFVAAFNARDGASLRAMLAPELEFIRPGGAVLRTPDAVLAQYEADWSMMSTSRVEPHRVVVAGDDLMAEITIHSVIDGRAVALPGAIAHRWRDGRLVRYRLYTDRLSSVLERRGG
jgi:ketosteroid isomerase-like protein